MKTGDLPLAIEALGYDKETIDINMHIEYYRNILRDAFYRISFKDVDGVGSRYEGLETGINVTEASKLPDTDFVLNLTDFDVKLWNGSDVTHKINVEKDLKIIPCPNFPGYVKLKLLKPIPGLGNFLHNYIFDEQQISSPEIQREPELRTAKRTKNGPASSNYNDLGHNVVLKTDIVTCLAYQLWPCEANKWISRNKPNSWPSKELIKTIKSRGFNLAPVGHYDSIDKAFQWRIGIRGEMELVRNLNETQTLCHIALRLILKDHIQLIQKDVLSSYHMKNVIFWCAEQESCQWTKDNFEICLKTCINRLIHFLTSDHFPHYFIEDRNLMNSKTTLELKKRIVLALTKYKCNIFAILSLNSFDQLNKLTNLKTALLQCKKQNNIIETCLGLYIQAFAQFYVEPNKLWETYAGHNTEINLQNAKDILSTLENTKRHIFSCHVAYARNMLGLLYYARYHETRCEKDNLKARELLISSLTFEHVSLKFRVANFYFMENEFNKCLGVCNAFFSNPKKHGSTREKVDHSMVTTAEIIMLLSRCTNVTKLAALKEKILEIFYENCKYGRQPKPETLVSHLMDFCDISYDVVLLIFKNLANLVFDNMSFNVPYLASEKWAVPEVFQHELLSVKEYHPESDVYGIYLDPMLHCLVLSFLCYNKTKNCTLADIMLTKMDNYIDKYSKLTNGGKKVPAEHPHSLPFYRVYNIVAYCCVKSRRYKQALNYILKSYKLYRRRNNAAYGYIKCICAVLNSLYVN